MAEAWCTSVVACAVKAFGELATRLSNRRKEDDRIRPDLGPVSAIATTSSIAQVYQRYLQLRLSAYAGVARRSFRVFLPAVC